MLTTCILIIQIYICYCFPLQDDENYDCEIDLDDLLDLEEVERPQFIKVSFVWHEY